MLSRSSLISCLVASFIAYLGCGCRSNDEETNFDDGQDSGVEKTLGGRWHGVFETKISEGAVKNHQATFEFSAEKTFVLTFREVSEPKATGTWEDSSDALLLRILESSILPEFPPESFVKLTYKLRGKTLTLTGDEAGVFTLTRQDSPSSPPVPPASEPFGWWKGTDKDGLPWGIHLDASGAFWTQAGNLIMRGTHARTDGGEFLLEVKEAGDDGLIGRRFIFALAGADAANLSVLKPGGTAVSDAREVIALARSN